MEFLDVIETIKAERAEAGQTYTAEDGRTVGALRGTARYQESFDTFVGLVTKAKKGDRTSYRHLQEAMTTSDFPYLFGDILDRQLLAKYATYPTIWPAIARRGTLRDFRQVSRFTLDGGEGYLTAVKERTEYPAASLSDGRYQYGLTKYGRRLPFTWEDFINDDLGALEGSPDRLATAAAVSEDRFITGLFAGNFSTYFTSGNGNVVTSNVLGFTNSANPALNITALQIAMAVAGNQKNADGNPIYVNRWHLVVPPALEVAANNIINATEIVAATGGGFAGSAANQGGDVLHVANWVKNRIDVVVNPWLPVMDATQGNTAWYLFADAGSSRPTMELGKLRGHESPELFMKAPNATRVGGGTVDAMDGDFDTDSVEYKVRHTFGGTMLDVKGAVGSKGTNS